MEKYTFNITVSVELDMDQFLETIKNGEPIHKLISDGSIKLDDMKIVVTNGGGDIVMDEICKPDEFQEFITELCGGEA